MARRMIDLRKMSLANKKEFRDRYDAYFFDMDGCLVQLEGPALKGTSDAINMIKNDGKSVNVLTNNCINTLENISSKVQKLFPAIKKENVFNTTYLLGNHLKSIKFNKKIYILGSDGIITDLKKFGFDVIYDERLLKDMSDLVSSVERREQGVGAVVVASDYNYTYLKLAKAVNYLASDPEVLLIQTHYPVIAVGKPILPGIGSLILPIMAASGRKETFCSGKGSECSIKYMKSLGHKMERSLFVGDGLENDIHFGNLCGMDTLLVLSGECTLNEVESAIIENKETFIPTYYTNAVADLIDIFKN